MRTLTLELDGGPLVADVHEPADPAAPTALLIHGWGGSSRYWRETIARLRSSFRLIVPDLPGVGRSQPVRRAFDMVGHLAAVEALLAELNVRQAHIVGHSMGAGVSMVLAARRPELVDRLVLTSISLFRTEAERRVFSAAMEVTGIVMRFRGRWMADVPGLVQLSARRVFYRVPDDAALLRESFLDYLEMDHATALACARSAGSSLVVDAAPRIAAPTLLVVSPEDQMMPVDNVPHTARTIPGCRVRWIANCGHLPMVEQPELYAQVVREFLEEEGSREREALP